MWTRTVEVATRAAGVGLLAALGMTEAWHEGGSIAGRDWTGYAVIAVLALAAALASGAAAAPSRRAVAAAGALAGLAAWDAIALTWSPTPPLGRDEALLALLYAAALLVPAVLLHTAVDRTAALAAVTAIGGASSLAAAVQLVGASDPSAVYLTGRLQYPIAYTNAQAALFLVVFWPAVVLAAERVLPVLVRGAALGIAGASAAGWALVQSKGALVGLAVSTVVVLAVHRRRLRVALPLALVGIVVGVAFHALTGPYRARPGTELAAIHHAGRIALLVAVVSAGAGLAYALADRRVGVGEHTARLAGRAAAALCVIGLCAGAAAFLHAHPHPGSYLSEKWQEAKHQSDTESGSSHLSYLGSSRYDFWRVALRSFEAHPLAGIGTRGFRLAYLQARNSDESPARAHSVELDALAETGIVGFLLLGTALALLLVALIRRARDDLVTVGALGAFVCWFVHTSADWTWSFPAIGLPLFALAGIGISRTGAPRLRPRLALPAAALALAIAVGAYGLPWLAGRYVQAALHGGPASDLATARSLDPISLDPDLAAALLAPSAQDAIAPLRDALRQEPRSPDLRYALGHAYRLAGDRASARRLLRSALAVDPGDSTILHELGLVRGN